jgi:hypothetical protein
LGDDCTHPHLTKEYYERSLNIDQPSNKDDDINNTDVYVYQEMTDSIIDEVQHKYNLRPKKKPVSTPQPKKILPRGKIYDPSPKETEISNIKIKGLDSQNPKVKKAETQAKKTKIA